MNNTEEQVSAEELEVSTPKKNYFNSASLIASRVHAILKDDYLDDPSKAEDLQEPLDEWKLCQQGLLSEQDIAKAYVEVTALTMLEEDELEDVEAFDGLSYDYLVNQLCIPIQWDDTTMQLAVTSPYQSAKLITDCRMFINRHVTFVLVRRSVVERFLTSLYEHRDSAGDMEWGGGDASEETLQNLAKEAPIVRLVNDTFSRALDMGASDIHIEPLENEFVIRYRVDGMLQTVSNLPLNMYPAVASRVKLIGGMNIAEHRLPQDGRTEMQIGKSKIDVRISTVPSTNGESIVLRILLKNVQNFSLESVGMSPDIAGQFTKNIKLPHGIVLVVGPTGSGKSTTLYCAMNILNTDKNKILTVEDPVEYQISGITQVQVRQGIGLTFASSLRAFLRQDPDIILVGEIRDCETAEIAIHAALTGHLVLSTLHTNDAAGSISRLQDMGVENFLISSSLSAVLSQRLVRKVCAACGGTGLEPGHPDNDTKRCRNCSGTGYRGRVGIFEFMEINEEIRKGINANLDSGQIAEIARRNGMTTLRDDGERKAKLGETTLAEVSRVCQLDANF